MTSHRFVLLAASLSLLFLLSPISGQTQDTLPATLSDTEFWALIEQLSEPDGFFRSNSGSPDNLLSNESSVSMVATALATRVKPSGVYLGVGPEQNFTYIAAIRPRIAIITDIRRGNLHLHLMYKAIFEMSATRADFVSLLFTRKRPTGITTRSTAAELMNATLRAERGDDAAFQSNLKAISDHLTKTRRLTLGAEDLAGIEYVYRNFHRFGPDIQYTSSIGGRSGTSYAMLMAATDATRAERGYLANEDNFAFIKGMEQKNLIVPIVGDFAGPKALRAIGTFLKARGATVTAFYVSNVEMYLQNNGVWATFCANVASMPLDAASTFIRPEGGRLSGGQFGAMAAETAGCAR
jgi:hypothetical protein